MKNFFAVWNDNGRADQKAKVMDRIHIEKERQIQPTNKPGVEQWWRDARFPDTLYIVRKCSSSAILV